MEKQRLLQQPALIKELGFSLIELVVVIAILTILLASYASFSIVKSGAGVRIHYTANQIATDLRLTQSLAMSLNRPYQVNFYSSSYSVTDLNNNPAWLNSDAINLPSGVSITSTTPSTVIFNGRGVPYANSSTPLSNTLSVILQTTINDQRTVNIIPDTGSVGVTNP